jgi:hypothetical protein
LLPYRLGCYLKVMVGTANNYSSKNCLNTGTYEQVGASSCYMSGRERGSEG